MLARKPQRKRTPVTLMAGSGRTPYLQKPPQVPPRNIKIQSVTPQAVLEFLAINKVAKTNPVEEFHRLFGSEPPPQEKILTIDDVAPVAMPKCPHSVRLTK